MRGNSDYLDHLEEPSHAVRQGNALAKGTLYARRDSRPPAALRAANEFADSKLANSRRTRWFQTGRKREAIQRPLALFTP